MPGGGKSPPGIVIQIEHIREVTPVMSDSETLFQFHVKRMANEAEDDLRGRKTGVKCEGLHHPEGAKWDAVVIVEVDNSACCPRNEDNKQVRLCWICNLQGAYRDEYDCPCQENDSRHKSGELKFVGEIQPKEQKLNA